MTSRRGLRGGVTLVALISPILAILLVTGRVSGPIAFLALCVCGVVVQLAWAFRRGQFDGHYGSEPFEAEPAKRWRLHATRPPNDEAPAGLAGLLPFVLLALFPILGCFLSGQTLWGFALLVLLAAGAATAFLLTRAGTTRPRGRGS